MNKNSLQLQTKDMIYLRACKNAFFTTSACHSFNKIPGKPYGIISDQAEMCIEKILKQVV